MKAYIKFLFEILPLAIFFIVNSVENISIVDNIYSIFFSIDDKFFKATFFLVLTSLFAIPVAWYIDKKIPLDEISESRGIDFDEILSELESIVFSGTKLDIDYYIDEILDEDQQEELKEYFLESESEDILEALEEFDGDYDEEELRLYRIKFLNDVSN